MSAISSLSTIFSTIDLNGDWEDITLGTGLNDVYLIGIKGQQDDSNIVDVSKVTSVVFEIAIPSGIPNTNITIQRAVLDFNVNTSEDEAVNKITAFVRLLNLPTTFKIRPVAIQTIDKQYKTGEVNIEVNLSPVSLREN